jgi:myeloid leukemia factor 1
MSVTSMSSGPDGRPQVYQASKQTACAPGGVRETRKSVMDSRTGTKKLAVGRHIGEQGLVREREENMYTGQREDNQELLNLEERKLLAPSALYCPQAVIIGLVFYLLNGNVDR